MGKKASYYYILSFFFLAVCAHERITKQITGTKVISCSCLLEIRTQYDKNNSTHPKAKQNQIKVCPLKG